MFQRIECLVVAVIESECYDRRCCEHRAVKQCLRCPSYNPAFHTANSHYSHRRVPPIFAQEQRCAVLPRDEGPRRVDGRYRHRGRFGRGSMWEN